MAVAALLIPFKEALIVGVHGGQRLRCPVSTLQRAHSERAAVGSGASPRYQYANRVTGEVVESARVDQLVERWMGDLDLSTQLDAQLRRNLEAAVRPKGERAEGGEGCER
jgi:hypothetical protein